MAAFSWEEICVLGQGSFGTVFLARINTNCNPTLIAVKSAIARFDDSLVREHVALKELKDCPEVVRCLGSQITGMEPKRYYNLLLEYAPGGTLSDLISRSKGGRLTETLTSCYTCIILKGLRDIHANGLVHCDLKPQNILAFPHHHHQMQLKIADFGLAKLDGDDDVIPKWRFRGTPLYMSPESVREGQIRPALDIWSLGCIVVEMFTGEKAMKFDGNNDSLRSFGVELGLLKRLPIIPEAMSDLGKDFLRKCFASDPAKRWTAEMLLHHEFVGGCRGRSVCSMPFVLPHQLYMANNNNAAGLV